MLRQPAADREAFWRKLIARQAASRLTVGELCRRAGVSTASFYAWRRRLESPDGVAPSHGAGSSSLVPVRIAAEPGGSQTFAIQTFGGQTIGGQIVFEVAIERSDSPAQNIRILIPPGCDEASIRRVLGAVLSVREGGRSSC